MGDGRAMDRGGRRRTRHRAGRRSGGCVRCPDRSRSCGCPSSRSLGSRASRRRMARSAWHRSLRAPEYRPCNVDVWAGRATDAWIDLQTDRPNKARSTTTVSLERRGADCAVHARLTSPSAVALPSPCGADPDRGRSTSVLLRRRRSPPPPLAVGAFFGYAGLLVVYRAGRSVALHVLGAALIVLAVSFKQPIAFLALVPPIATAISNGRVSYSQFALTLLLLAAIAIYLSAIYFLAPTVWFYTATVPAQYSINAPSWFKASWAFLGAAACLWVTAAAALVQGVAPTGERKPLVWAITTLLLAVPSCAWRSRRPEEPAIPSCPRGSR